MQESLAANELIHPAPEQIWRALRLTPPSQVRCVILGQDPYHGAGQANGLAFSVCHGTKLPPSLRNIFKELGTDLAITRTDGDLSDWASQGVLLLNSVLSVRDGAAGSHADWGWQDITSAIVAACIDMPTPICFVVWGAYAEKILSTAHGAHMVFDKTTGIGHVQSTGAQHPVKMSPHPSPLASYRGFFGSQPFSWVNEHLQTPPIMW